ncbi:hypothetical protein SAMD00019534_044090 [Acytostelium subglobosum LB1]|uniref:hypothetical protein n=1 Tax=Acytostelium subglobosum LB1 TaxID=1410327 RepID=UPI0006450CF6|nr:hypothetical protein SAMD00019534_044090 [Acytostelium subglobosum LB1]GAM21234.1 hypothetical protein SAMD00019534_044090 [Acytostelium subglobosum LB1]|eukprot:XP_012755353.1 hypothetical protein SAMD00019534_044090 [Acytostelium subglobosum LB1]
MIKLQYLLLLSCFIGTIYASQCFDFSCHVYNVTSAGLDPVYGPGPGLEGHALAFADEKVPGGITKYDFYNNYGVMTVVDKNTLIVTGTMVPSTGARAPYIEAKLVFRPFQCTTCANPKLELQANAYVPAGPIDPCSWKYFVIDTAASRLVGKDLELEGWDIILTPHMGMPLQVGKGANGKNLNLGMSSWFSFEFVKNGTRYTSPNVADINVDLTCSDCPSGDYAATAAMGPTGGQSAYVSSTDLTPFGGFQSFDFVNKSGNLHLESNGDMLLTGTLSPVSHDSPLLTCSLLFHPNRDYFRSMKLELDYHVYFPQGWVDPGTYIYYDIDTHNSQCISGETTIKFVGDMMMPMQLGYGANGKNMNYGMAVWLQYSVIRGGVEVEGPDYILDFNVDLTCQE